MIWFVQGAGAPADQNRIIEIPPHQKVVAILLAVVMLVVVLELVRKRKLREEYSIIWTLTALALLLLAWQPPLLDVFKAAIGAVEPISALFFGALMFLMLVSLQFSVRLSKLTFRNRNLGQRLAILERELADTRSQLAHTHPDPSPPDDGDSSTER